MATTPFQQAFYDRCWDNEEIEYQVFYMDTKESAEALARSFNLGSILDAEHEESMGRTCEPLTFRPAEQVCGPHHGKWTINVWDAVGYLGPYREKKGGE